MKRIWRALLYAFRLSPLNRGKFWWLAWLFGFSAAVCAQRLLIHLIGIGVGGKSDRGDYFETAGWFAGCLVLGSPAFYFGAKSWPIEQQRRNARAEKIAAEVGQSHAKRLANRQSVAPYVLFLRPFIYTGRLQMRNEDMLPIYSSFFRKPAIVEIDEYLQACLAPTKLSLICLGREDGMPGAGRIQTDDEKWWTQFKLLAQHAVSIAVIPGVQTGIEREMHFLRTMGLLDKTLFLKPERYPREDWDRAVELYDDGGFHLPDWDSHWISFRLFESGAVDEVQIWLWGEWSSKAKKQMAKLLQGPDKVELRK